MRLSVSLLIIGWIFSGCNFTTQNKIDPLPTKQAIGKKFFEYDQIDHYFNDYDESKIFELLDKRLKSETDTLKQRILLGGTPKDISDSSFIRKLVKIDFKKRSIEKAKFAEIDQFFVEKSVKENLETACIYVYRDILVFKKNEKVVGTAKICFSCMAHEITGTTANTDNFGQDGDYDKLGKLLRK